MSTNFKDYLAKQMQNPDFKAEYDALEPEFAIIQAMIDARRQSGLTQKELAQRAGMTQSDISRLENGSGNPSIRTLQRLAEGMGMRLQVSFVRR